MMRKGPFQAEGSSTLWSLASWPRAGTRLDCSFCAWQTAVLRALGKEAGSTCFHGFFFFFATFLLPRKPSPLCGTFRKALEVDSNSKSVSPLNCISFNNGKLKRQKRLTEGGKIPRNFCGVLPAWGEKWQANNNSLVWNICWIRKLKKIDKWEIWKL